MRAVYGGEGGIRTHETSHPRLRDFQSRSLNQLGHLSAFASAFGKATVYRRAPTPPLAALPEELVQKLTDEILKQLQAAK